CRAQAETQQQSTLPEVPPAERCAGAASNFEVLQSANSMSCLLDEDLVVLVVVAGHSSSPCYLLRHRSQSQVRWLVASCACWWWKWVLVRCRLGWLHPAS